MTNPELTAVESHVPDGSDYADEQIKDLYKALQQAEGAIAKLREASKSKIRSIQSLTSEAGCPARGVRLVFY